MRDRRQRSGAADLHLDVVDRCDRLPRGILVGNGPAWRLRRQPEPGLLFDRVDLDHHTVDVVGQLVTFRFPLATEREQFANVVAEPALGIYFEAHLAESFQRLPVAGEARLPIYEQIVGVVLKPTGSGDGGIEHTKRAGRRVARVSETGKALLFAIEVQPFERTPQHDGLTADFKPA